jgi:hypothetical protein
MHGRLSPILPFLGIEKKGDGSLALGVGIEMAVGEAPHGRPEFLKTELLMTSSLILV